MCSLFLVELHHIERIRLIREKKGPLPIQNINMQC